MEKITREQKYFVFPLLFPLNSLKINRETKETMETILSYF